MMWAKIKTILKGWKTMITAAFYAVSGIALELHDDIAKALGDSGVDWKTLIKPSYVPYILIGTGITFAVLRKVTTGPIGNKGDAAPSPNVKAGD